MPTTFYDAFHGVGGFRYGLEQAGWKCIGGCEIDKYACQAYGVINGERCEPTDIRNVDPGVLPNFDAFIFGWPCQDNSIAGKREGQRERTDSDEGNRSGLLFEAARILRAKKPRYFIAENVEGLFSVNDGLDFYQTIRLFTDLGYDCQWQLLNTRWFLPQNRERVFFVGHLRGTSRPEVFPFTASDLSTPGERGVDSVMCLHKTHGNSTSVKRGETGTLQAARLDKVPNVVVMGNTNPSGNGMNGQVYNADGLAPTLTTNKGEGLKVMVAGQLERDRGQTGNVYDPAGIAPAQLKQHGNAVTKIIQHNLVPGPNDISKTIRRGGGSSFDGKHSWDIVHEGYAIRKLTPLECFRLQGYPDEWFYKCKEAGISDSQLYKMAGNGVSSPVAREIALRF